MKFFTVLNGKFESAVTARRWEGNFAADNTGSFIPCVIIAKIYNNGTKADIHIECKFESFSNEGSGFNIFNVNALKAACNCTTINCDTKNTNVILYRLDGESPGTAEHFGRTGLLLHIDNTNSYFERIYNAEMESGGWNRSIPIYKDGNYAIMDAYGANIS